MSDQTTNLQLPYVMPAQAQKHVTINESLSLLDALVQTGVESRQLSIEPVSPADGAVWICPAGKTGAAWGAYTDGALAVYRDGAWSQLIAREGWRVWLKDERRSVVFSGAQWREDAPASRMRNLLINGDFRVWQRGETHTHGGARYTADRWRASRGQALSGMTVSRQTGPTGAAALRHARNAGDTQTGVESGVVQILNEDASGAIARAGAATLSFKIRTGADFTGSLHALIQCADDAAAAVANTGTLNASDVTAEMSLSITPDTQQKTYSLTLANAPLTTRRVIVAFSWSGQTGTAGAACWFEVEEVQLELGGEASSFEQRPLTMEEALCLAYFERQGGVSQTPLAFGLWATSTKAALFVRYARKRAAPSIVHQGDFEMWWASGAAVTNVVFNGIGRDGARLVIDRAAGGQTVGGAACAVAATSSTVLDIDAELS